MPQKGGTKGSLRSHPVPVGGMYQVWVPPTTTNGDRAARGRTETRRQRAPVEAAGQASREERKALAALTGPKNDQRRRPPRLAWPWWADLADLIEWGPARLKLDRSLRLAMNRTPCR